MQYPVAGCRCVFPALILAAGLGFPGARAEPRRIVPPLPEPRAVSPSGAAEPTHPLGRDFAAVPIFPSGQRLVVAGAPRTPQPAGDRAPGTTRLLIIGLGLGSTALAVWCSLRKRG